MKCKCRKLVALVLLLGIVFSAAAPVSAATFFYGQTPLSYRIDALEELITEMREIYKDEIDLDTIFDGIYVGLFDSFGDPWTAYYPNKEEGTSFITTDLEEEYEGIGVVMRKNDNGFLITSTVIYSPAYRAGLRTGDYIIRVNGTDVRSMESDAVVSLIRGAGGSSLTLTIDRDGELKNFTVQRETIRTNTVNYKMLDKDCGYIQIKSFASNTDEDFEAAYKELLGAGMSSLVIDLRDNGGGSVESAVNIADQLIHEKGTIATLIQKGEVIDTFKSTEDDIHSVKTAVLTNKETASASELLCAALKDRGAATLVGTTTYGKGVAQAVMSAAKDAVFKISIYYFVSPSGNTIDGVGVSPDIAVYGAEKKSEEELAKINDGLAPLTETIKYYKGQTGLNVYAAQQRLRYLGYSVDINGTMDDKTIAALKIMQAEAGCCPYGGLDFTTIRLVNTAFNNWLNPAGEDVQLNTALDYLKGL